MATRVLGVACYLSGRRARARQLFDDVLRDIGDPQCEAYALAFLSLIAADEDRWEDAADLDRQVVEHSPEMSLDISPGMFFALPMLLAHTRVLAWRDSPGFAAQRERTERHIEQMVPQAEWRLILAFVLLRQALEQRRRTDPLTPAERRVLELLPTQLTAEQMATRLFVSKNTVKTHMRRLYTKLDVTSRTAVVERARELRLLPPTTEG